MEVLLLNQSYELNELFNFTQKISSNEIKNEAEYM